MTTGSEQLLDSGTVGQLAADALDASRIEVSVHDASRLAWNVSLSLPERGRLDYELELELELPDNLLSSWDPWTSLQTYGRLAGGEDAGAAPGASPEAFRRRVVEVSVRLARARGGFVRHCTQIRSSPRAEENHSRALLLWTSAASCEVARAREGLLQDPTNGDEPADERRLAAEYLSAQLWAALTDCVRALMDTRRALEERSVDESLVLEKVEQALADAIGKEIAYRRDARFAVAEPVNALQLERLLSKMRAMKKHFERVLFLQAESYQVVNRLAGWFSALTAIMAYLWFFFWQVTLERHPAAVGSGIVAFALITAVAYASRERLKESGRNWLAGRVQRMFAQRVTRYRLPGVSGVRAALVASALESFSQSAAERDDGLHLYGGPKHNVTVLRFAQRGVVGRPAALEGVPSQEVRFTYRLDLSSLFCRLHDAVRGFASPDPLTGRLTIIDVPRNYTLPVRARLRCGAERERTDCTLVLNKNGLVRIEDEGP